MNKTLQLILLNAFGLFSYSVHANLWQCAVTDNMNQQWIAKSTFQRMAINKAFHACKKQSNYPRSCTAAKEACEHFINGRSTQPMWRCTALDKMAHKWKSNLYKYRNDAALGAKAYCKAHSGMPSSCYVNLLTCKNVNKT